MERLEIWRGSAAAWECDEMGHLNVRHYVAKFAEGLQGLARHLGMPGAFTPHATSTLQVQTHHLRFLREARAGAPLYMTGGVVSLSESRAQIVQCLHHAGSHEPAAAALSDVAHVEPRSGREFPWAQRTRRLSQDLILDPPAFAKPRSIDVVPSGGEASLERALALGMTCIARGSVRPEDVDVFGRMQTQVFIGRVSDGVPSFLSDIRSAVRETAGSQVRRLGGAVLEYRLTYGSWPKAGDHLELRTGLKAVGDKTQTMVHWLLDPVTGQAYGAAEAVAVNLDLDARKIVAIAPEARERLIPRVIADLSL